MPRSFVLQSPPCPKLTFLKLLHGRLKDFNFLFFREKFIQFSSNSEGSYTQWSVTSTKAYVCLTLYLSLLITNNNIAPLGAEG